MYFFPRVFRVPRSLSEWTRTVSEPVGTCCRGVVNRTRSWRLLTRDEASDVEKVVRRMLRETQRLNRPHE